jgi:phosphoserine phosphatase RsbU/P
MATMTETFLQEQLLERRTRLQSSIAASGERGSLVQLLRDVDSALERMEKGTYGICEVCHETVEADRLMADPLVRYCLDHLTPVERDALQYDLELAARLQRDMLPATHTAVDGWEVFYHYEPVGAVSGDYCDLVTRPADDGLFFMLGDVSGKGIAASMLMTQLHAIFRSLIVTRMPVEELMERASSIFCESALSPYFATLVCGQASSSGEILLSNAGHCPPLLLKDGSVARLEATGVPLGMFCEGKYPAHRARLEPGESLLLYTDGLSEARDRQEREYGEVRLLNLLSGDHERGAKALVSACLDDWQRFRAGSPIHDDVTVMAIHRAA